MSFFDDLEETIKKSTGYNSNFGFDRIDWTTRIWIYEMCQLIDKKLDEMDERIYKDV